MTETAQETSAAANRPPLFTKELKIFLSPEQDAWLEREVQRRREAAEVSTLEAAHGGNRNVNKGMLIREALERTFKITS